jgi:hypothetical protein
VVRNLSWRPSGTESSSLASLKSNAGVFFIKTWRQLAKLSGVSLGDLFS